MRSKYSSTLRFGATSAVLAAAAALSACGSGSGAATTENPGGSTGGTSTAYSGPAPATADVQAFKINLFDNVRGNNRCGSCHGVGGQSPTFARSDDVNLAYAAANTVVTLESPGDSLMVLKVAGGHNCWLQSASACADILETWITNWAGNLVSGGARQIELEPPQLRDPGSSKSFPANPGLFGATVHPLLVEHCADCHTSTSALKQQPFFAEGPSNNSLALATAYEAAKSKMNLDDPASSRFVVRLGDEAHNCWTASCTNDASAMRAAIQSFADGVPTTEVNPDLITSKATTLYEGTVASGGNRYEANVIALYEFKTGQDCGSSIAGSCSIAYDTSGVDPAMDLTLSGNVQWFGGWGLNFSGGKAQASTASSAKLHSSITATGEYSIEAWVAPGNVVQEDMRIVSYSGGLTRRNFTLGQTMYDYEFFNRSDASDANGSPQLSTPSADEVLQATLQHVVATYDPVEGRKIYVNGELVTQGDPVPGGTLADWDDTFAFVLGNEVSGDREWMGVIRLVAIHNRVLTPEQILQNFEAGVGEKFYLMFSVSHLIDVPDSYVVFEASQFDSYAYLFREPFFVSLDETAQPNGIELRGMRIALNGAEVPVGQSYARLRTEITSGDYSPEGGQVLTRLGAVLPLEKGPKDDEFFLTFDRLGSRSYLRPAAPTPTLPPPPIGEPVSQVGVRTFDEIAASMAALTGVSQLEPGVRATYDKIRESLPTVESLDSVVASHQVAIAQLAIAYCNALINDTNLRTSQEYGFPGFPFTSNVADAWPGPGAVEDLFFDPLLDRVLGEVQLGSQPSRAFVKDELRQLVHGLDTNDPDRRGLAFGGGDQSRTQSIAKAVCASVVGSAAMLVQ